MRTEDRKPLHDSETLQRRLNTRFKDPKLLVAALTHRSHAFEQGGGLPHNERLEFLGDAVLGLAVTDMIFSWYPTLPEGEMAKLRASAVNMAVLADVARRLNLGDDLLLGRGEEQSGGRNKSSILADALEAVLGAIYLDQGMEPARRLVEEWFGPLVREHVEQDVVRDFKTNLQEVAAKQGRMPDYRISSSGPDHAKRFRAEVFLDGRLFGVGEGRSKKEAEQAAAKEATSKLEQT